MECISYCRFFKIISSYAVPWEHNPFHVFNIKSAILWTEKVPKGICLGK